MGIAQPEGSVTLGTVIEWGMAHEQVGRILGTFRCGTEPELGLERLCTVTPVSRPQQLQPQVRADGYG